MRIAIVGALAALLLVASPAYGLGWRYEVGIRPQDPDGSGTCFGSGSSFTETCTNLRAAVSAANTTPGLDSIVLPEGFYSISQGQLTLSDDVIVTGAGARSTWIGASGSRVFRIDSGVTARIALVTIAGGTASSGDGGNILNAGHLTLQMVRLTGGSAERGGGLANSPETAPVSADIVQSLIDRNFASIAGAGIANVGSAQAATLALTASTVAFNGFGQRTGSVNSGISTGGNASDSVSLVESTIARNTGTGLEVTTGSAHVLGSIFATNMTNCTGTAPEDRGGNLDDATSCRFAAASSFKNANLSASLTDAGGQTDVLTIPPDSPAIDAVKPCVFNADQRDVPRVSDASQPCDAGAYELVTTPPPVATPRPTPVATPTPVAGKTIVAAPVNGKVLVRRPGAKRFVTLHARLALPVGSIINARHGTVELTSIQTAKATPQTARFFQGVFRVTQTKTTTDLILDQAIASCRKRTRRTTTRWLWGSGSGSFRIRGRYSSATTRDAEWLVRDSCSGTLTRVKRGAVSVRDQVKRKTLTVRAPHGYLARRSEP